MLVHLYSGGNLWDFLFATVNVSASKDVCSKRNILHRITLKDIVGLDIDLKQEQNKAVNLISIGPITKLALRHMHQRRLR